MWATSAYNGLCFEKRRRWLLLVEPQQQSRASPRATSFSSGGFQRFPLKVQVVPNRTTELSHRAAKCWRSGVTFVADLRHSGATMGIAHFAKRILRLHGLLQQAHEYGLPSVTRVSFPATISSHLAHSWPSSMLRLIAPSALVEPYEAMASADCCYETVVTSALDNIYFLRPQDADMLRTGAYAVAGVPQSRPACAPIVACYFQRSEGKPSGRWEGGARLVVNKQALLQMMVEEMTRASPHRGGTVREVNINSTHNFAEQVALFATCDIMASVHGSQNANLMFMRPGAAMMEINPHKFYYSSYERLANVTRVLYLSSRRNSIAVHTREAARFLREYANTTDVACQEISRCRSLSRNFPTFVNETDFRHEFARGLAHVMRSIPSPPQTCPPAQPITLSSLAGHVAKDQAWPGGALRRALSGSRRRSSLVSARLSRVGGSADATGARGAGPAGIGRGRGRGRGGRGARAAGIRRSSVDGGVAGSSAGVLAMDSGVPRRTGTGGLRIAVCVAGQLSRLEIDSKVENVLKPTAASQPAALDVFLALEVGKTIYSNLDMGAIIAQQQGTCGAGALTPEAAKDRLAPWLRGARFSNHTTRAIDMAEWKRYRKDRAAAERATRLQHHLSQFAHMRTCAQLIEAHEVAVRQHYDVVLKMRDNTIAISPFVISAKHAEGKAMVKGCIDWGGYNDKVMTIPRRYMDGALRVVAEDFFLTRHIGKGIPNSERLLYRVLDRNGVKVQKVDAHALPLVDGRCSGSGWCLVEVGKDCRPPQWSWPSKPCLELNTTAAQKEIYDRRFEQRAKIEHLMKSTVGVEMNEP